VNEQMIICPKCPDIYPAEKILAYLNDEPVTTLASLRANLGSAPIQIPRGVRAIRAALGIQAPPEESKKPNPTVLPDLRAYTFECPEGHLVDGSPGEPFGIALLGESGASKSHMLPAIVREMGHMSALRRLGIRVSEPLYPSPKLTQHVTDVYEFGRRLTATTPGEMLGPFGCKLTIGGTPTDRKAKKYSLEMYDVAGENLESVSNIAEHAKFITFSRGMILLVDPVRYLPTQFDEGPMSTGQRLDAGRAIRRTIQAIADTLTEIWGVDSPQDLEIPLCCVVAKADAIDWAADFDWRGQLDSTIDAVADGEAIRTALARTSWETRERLAALGGDLVIDEVEENFNPEFVRWAAASATSTMPASGVDPGGRDWVDEPEPCGVALSVLQVLDAAGVVPRPDVPQNGPAAAPVTKV
jgi:hypothetical protein